MNTFITAGGSNGAATGDMKSDRRASEGGNDDFTDVSVDQLGMLVHTI